jgi:hypothetical protein
MAGCDTKHDTRRENPLKSELRLRHWSISWWEALLSTLIQPATVSAQNLCALTTNGKGVTRVLKQTKFM